jgi:transposase
MPWKEWDRLKERTKIILESERHWNEPQGGRVNVAELCRMYGVSRPAGYLWINRYCEAKHDLDAVQERSRKPKTSPHAITPEMEDLIVAARKRYPKWGPRKLHARLVETNPGVRVPSASVIAKVLKRRGLTTGHRRRRRAAPNGAWCIDFKGWFLTGDGRRCYPLTLIDAFSRYLLRCEALLDPNGAEVEAILDSAFSEFDLPAIIGSDGGPPFASTGPAGLTELSVWLLRTESVSRSSHLAIRSRTGAWSGCIARSKQRQHHHQGTTAPRSSESSISGAASTTRYRPDTSAQRAS